MIFEAKDIRGDSFLGEKGYPPGPKQKTDGRKYRELKEKLSGDATLAGLWKDVQPTLDSDLAALEKK